MTESLEGDVRGAVRIVADGRERLVTARHEAHEVTGPAARRIASSHEARRGSAAWLGFRLDGEVVIAAPLGMEECPDGASLRTW